MQSTEESFKEGGDVKMSSYEYMIKKSFDYHLLPEDRLNELGQDEWELVAIVPPLDSESMPYCYYFKRERE